MFGFRASCNNPRSNVLKALETYDQCIRKPYRRELDIFLDTETTKEAVIQDGIAICQYIYHGPDTKLGEIRNSMFSRKAVAGVIKSETLPPTKGAVAQRALRLPVDPGLDPSTEHVSEPQ